MDEPTENDNVFVYLECEFCTGLFPIDAVELHIKVGHELENRPKGSMMPIRRAFAVTELPHFFAKEKEQQMKKQQKKQQREREKKQKQTAANHRESATRTIVPEIIVGDGIKVTCDSDYGPSPVSSSSPESDEDDPSFGSKKSSKKYKTRKSGTSRSAIVKVEPVEDDDVMGEIDRKRKRASDAASDRTPPRKYKKTGKYKKSKSPKKQPTPKRQTPSEPKGPPRGMQEQVEEFDRMRREKFPELAAKELTGFELRKFVDKDERGDVMQEFPPLSECHRSANGTLWVPCPTLNRHSQAFVLCSVMANADLREAYCTDKPPNQIPDVEGSWQYIIRLDGYGKQDFMDMICEDGGNWSPFFYHRRCRGYVFDGLHIKPYNIYTYGRDLKFTFVKACLEEFDWTHMIYYTMTRNSDSPNQLRLCALVMSRQTYKDFAFKHVRATGSIHVLGEHDRVVPVSCWPWEYALVAYRTFHKAIVVTQADGSAIPTTLPTAAGDTSSAGSPPRDSATPNVDARSETASVNVECGSPKSNGAPADDEDTVDMDLPIATHPGALPPRTLNDKLVKGVYVRPLCTTFSPCDLPSAARRQQAIQLGFDNTCNGPFIGRKEKKAKQSFTKHSARARSQENVSILSAADCERSANGRIVWIPLPECSPLWAAVYMSASWDRPYLISKDLPTAVPEDRSKAFIYNLGEAYKDKVWDTYVSCVFEDDGGEWMFERRGLIGYWIENGEVTRRQPNQLKYSIEEKHEQYTHCLAIHEYKNVSCPDLSKFRYGLLKRDDYWTKRHATRFLPCQKDVMEAMLFETIMVHYCWYGKPRAFKRMPKGMFTFYTGIKFPDLRAEHDMMKLRDYVKEQLGTNYTADYQRRVLEQLQSPALRQKFNITMDNATLKERIRFIADQVGAQLRFEHGTTLVRTNRQYKVTSQKWIRKAEQRRKQEEEKQGKTQDDDADASYNPDLEDEELISSMAVAEVSQPGPSTGPGDRASIMLEIRKIDVNGPFMSDVEFRLKHRALLESQMTPDCIVKFEDCMVDQVDHHVIWVPLPKISVDIAAYYLAQAYNDTTLVSDDIPNQVPHDKSRGYIFDMRNIPKERIWDMYLAQTNDDGGQRHRALYTHYYYNWNPEDGSLSRAEDWAQYKVKRDSVWTHVIRMQSWRMSSCHDVIKFRFLISAREVFEKYANDILDPQRQESRNQMRQFDIAFVYYHWFGPPRAYQRIELSEAARQELRRRAYDKEMIGKYKKQARKKTDWWNMSAEELLDQKGKIHHRKSKRLYSENEEDVSRSSFE